MRTLDALTINTACRESRYHGEVGVEGEELQVDLVVDPLLRVLMVVLAHDVVTHFGCFVSSSSGCRTKKGAIGSLVALVDSKGRKKTRQMPVQSLLQQDNCRKMA